MFEYIKIITLRACYVAKTSGHLPEYLGSTVRGVMGHCFREFVGCSRNKCFACSKQEECLSVRYFSSTGGEAGAVNPYVIHVYTNGKTEWAPGDACIFDLTLFGRAAENGGIYLDALIAMQQQGWGAERLSFQLIQVSDPDTGLLIYGSGKCWMSNLRPRFMETKGHQANEALLMFDTPVSIESGKELFQSLPFETLIQFLSRRISLITQAFTDQLLEWDVDSMMQKAAGIKIISQEWTDNSFERYSIRQKENRIELPCRIGWVMYEGELGPFTPILEAGKHFHVGKKSTIGFGHYQISFDR